MTDDDALYVPSFKGDIDAVRSTLATTSPTALPVLLQYRNNGRTPLNDDDVHNGGATPLYVAVQQNHFEIVQLLLSGGADKDAPRNDGATPLLSATSRGHLAIAELLIAAGAQVDACKTDGTTPLYHAASRGFLDIVEFLCSAGAKPDIPTNDGTTPLYIACVGGHLKVVELLLLYGADPTIPRTNGSLPIWAAALNGHISVVELLLTSGMGVEPSPALSYAVSNGHCSIVELLLLHGAGFGKETRDGTDLLYTAALKGYTGVAELLLFAGVKVDSPSSDGKSSLFVASITGHVAIVDLLVAFGANMNLTGDQGMTPLWGAAYNGHRDVVLSLICAGADRRLSCQGRTPRQAAFQQGHTEIVKSFDQANQLPLQLKTSYEAQRQTLVADLTRKRQLFQSKIDGQTAERVRIESERLSAKNTLKSLMVDNCPDSVSPDDVINWLFQQRNANKTRARDTILGQNPRMRRQLLPCFFDAFTYLQTSDAIIRNVERTIDGYQSVRQTSQSVAVMLKVEPPDLEALSTTLQGLTVKIRSTLAGSGIPTSSVAASSSSAPPPSEDCQSALARLRVDLAAIDAALQTLDDNLTAQHLLEQDLFNAHDLGPAFQQLLDVFKLQSGDADQSQAQAVNGFEMIKAAVAIRLSTHVQRTAGIKREIQLLKAVSILVDLVQEQVQERLHRSASVVHAQEEKRMEALRLARETVSLICSTLKRVYQAQALYFTDESQLLRPKFERARSLGLLDVATDLQQQLTLLEGRINGTTEKLKGVEATMNQFGEASIFSPSSPPPKKSDGHQALLDTLLCPITHELMVDPVVAADGHTYDRLAIQTWLVTNDRSPMTNTVLKHKDLEPNWVVKSLLEKIKQL